MTQLSHSAQTTSPPLSRSSVAQSYSKLDAQDKNTVVWEADLRHLSLCKIPSSATHILVDPFSWNNLAPSTKWSVTQRAEAKDQTDSALSELKEQFPGRQIVAVLCHAQWLQHAFFDRADGYYIPGPHCRQGDLLSGAAKTAKPLFVERGSFLAPTDFWNVIERTRGVALSTTSKTTNKTTEAAAASLTLVDAGSHFGYGDRVLDPRSLVLCSSWRARFGVSFGLSFTDLIGPEDSGSEYRPSWLSESVFAEFVFKMSTLWNCAMVFKKHSLLGFKFLNELAPQAEHAFESLAELLQVSRSLKKLSFDFALDQQKNSAQESL